MNEQALRKSIVEVCKRMYVKNLIASNDGNVSVKLDDTNLLITPSGVPKGNLSLKQIVRIRFDGTPVHKSQTPSSEFMMHVASYQIRQDIRAVTHGHPPYATSFATARIPLDSNSLPEIISTLKRIPLSDYGTPGTLEMAEVIKRPLRDHDAVLLANHGVITVGRDVWDAYYKMERTEHFAKIIFISRLLGGEIMLSQENIMKILKTETRTN